jgi:hypothetical protein
MDQDNPSDTPDILADLQDMEESCFLMHQYLQDMTEDFEIPQLDGILGRLEELGDLFANAQGSFQEAPNTEKEKEFGDDLYTAVSAIIEKYHGKKRAFSLSLELLPDTLH